MLFALIYGAGFLVVCLHHAQFGIAELSLIKVRVLSAGFIFLLLTAIPTVTAARLFRYFKLDSTQAIAIQSKPEDRPYQQATLLLCAYIAAVFMASASSSLIFVPEFTKPRGLEPWSFIGLLAISAGLAPMLGRYFPEHPRKCLVLTVCLTPLLGFLVYRCLGLGCLFLSLWYYACTVATYLVRGAIRKPQILRTFEVERYIFLPIVLIGSFAVWIYGNVRPEYGGGAPIPIQLYVTPEGAKVLGAESASVWLVEETDFGFYVLRSRDQKESLLLPRTLIRGVEFSGDHAGESAQKKTTSPATPR